MVASKNKENIPSESIEENKEINVEDFSTKQNPWKITAVILGIAVIVLLVFMFRGGITGNVISESDAAQNLINFATSKGVNIEVIEVTDSGSFYNIKATMNGQQTSFPVTKDGKYLLSGVLPITGEVVGNSDTENQQQPAEVTKSDKPKVELFVMSFCPYGVRAENNIFPILKLLGNKIDFKIRFIVNVNGDKIEDVSSLHGLYEAKEDARQLVINKYYPNKFLTYIENFNKVCYPLGNDESKIDTCWKSEATKLGMDVKKIESSAYGSEGITLLKSEESAATQYGASGSPTLMINGVKSSAIYSGTSATQTAICSAFNTAPSECKTVVQAADTTSTPAGSC